MQERQRQYFEILSLCQPHSLRLELTLIAVLTILTDSRQAQKTKEGFKCPYKKY